MLPCLVPIPNKPKCLFQGYFIFHFFYFRVASVWFCLVSGYVFVCMCHNIFGSLVTNETFVI